MADAGRDLTELLFSTVQDAPASREQPARASVERATPASVEQWRQTLRLDDLEQQYNLPAGLMTSVLRQESGGDPRVKSSAGAQGLFQFMPKTAAAYKIDPFDPQQAAPAAAKELSTLYTKYRGDVDRTLAAWNWGQGNVDRKGMANMPSETRGFLTNVKRFLSPGVPTDQPQQTAQRAPVAQSQPMTAQPPTSTLLSRMSTFLTPASAEAATGPAGRDLTGSQGSAGGGRDLTDLLPAPATEMASPDEAAATVARLKARQSTLGPPETVAGAEESASTVARLRAKPETRQALVQEELRQWEQQQGRPWREGDPRMPSELRLGVPDEAPLERPIPIPQLPPIVAPPEGKGLLSDLPWWAKAGLATGTSVVGGAGVAAAGGAIGGMLLPGVGAVPGGVAGELIGSAAARLLNVKLGLEEPGLVGDISSVAVPAVLRGTGAGIKGAVPRLPGAGVVRHEMAEEGVTALEQRLAPQVASDALWQQANQTNTAIATADVWRTAGDVARRKATTPGLTASDPGRQAAQDLLDLAKKYGNQVPIHELDAARRNLVPHLRDPEVARMYGAILSDMETAVARGVPGAAELRQAIATTRYEHALDDLADLWSPGKGIQKLDGDITQVHGKRIQNQFEKRLTANPTFAKAFAPAELADIRETLKTVARLSAVSPASGGGFAQQLKRHGLALTGAVTGTAYGGPAVGAAVGLGVEAMPYVLAAAMKTAPGRAAIRAALAEGHGRLTGTGIAAINAVVRQGLATAEPERPQPGLSGSPGQWP